MLKRLPQAYCSSCKPLFLMVWVSMALSCAGQNQVRALLGDVETLQQSKEKEETLSALRAELQVLRRDIEESRSNVMPVALIRLKRAFRAQQWREVWRTGSPLSALRALTTDETIWVSFALTAAGRHDEAVDWARKALQVGVNEALVGRLVGALAQAGENRAVLRAWKRYKSVLSAERFDPHIIANVLHAYARLELNAEALAELESWFQKEGRGGDSGLMHFNAACLYSLSGRLQDALLMVGRSLKAGMRAEKFDTDADLAAVRAHPGYALLLAGRRG